MSTVHALPAQQRELILELTVPGEPVPKARPLRRRDGRSFTSGKVIAAESEIEILARRQIRYPARGPIVLDVDFFMGNARKVDLDNLWKLAADALNGTVFEDDSQIVQAMVGKHVDRARPRTELRVWRIVESE